MILEDMMTLTFGIYFHLDSIKKIRQNSGRFDRYPPRFPVLQTTISMHRMKDSYYTKVLCAMKVNLVLEYHCGRTAQSLSLRLP